MHLLILLLLTDIYYIKIGNGTPLVIDGSLTDVVNEIASYSLSDFIVNEQFVDSFKAEKNYGEYDKLPFTTFSEIGFFDSGNNLIGYIHLPYVHFDQRMLSSFYIDLIMT